MTGKAFPLEAHACTYVPAPACLHPCPRSVQDEMREALATGALPLPLSNHALLKDPAHLDLLFQAYHK